MLPAFHTHRLHTALITAVAIVAAALGAAPGGK
jgi:hypothetical protein